MVCFSKISCFAFYYFQVSGEDESAKGKEVTQAGFVAGFARMLKGDSEQLSDALRYLANGLDSLYNPKQNFKQVVVSVMLCFYCGRFKI